MTLLSITCEKCTSFTVRTIVLQTLPRYQKIHRTPSMTEEQELFSEVSKRRHPKSGLPSSLPSLPSATPHPPLVLRLPILGQPPIHPSRPRERLWLWLWPRLRPRPPPRPRNKPVVAAGIDNFPPLLRTAHITNFLAAKPSATRNKVPSTEITHVRRVRVLTLQPSGRERSSHRSCGPRGQMESLVSGERMGRRDGLGTQVPDCTYLAVRNYDISLPSIRV